MKKIFVFIVSCLLMGAFVSCGDFVYDATYPSSVYYYHPSYVRHAPPPPIRKSPPPPPQRGHYNHHSHPRR